jgi:hypothetical protein
MGKWMEFPEEKKGGGRVGIHSPLKISEFLNF